MGVLVVLVAAVVLVAVVPVVLVAVVLWVEIESDWIAESTYNETKFNVE